MGRIQYIVAEDHGQWFVEVRDQLYGPYRSQELAVKDAIRATRTAPDSEVVVQGRPERAYGDAVRRRRLGTGL